MKTTLSTDRLINDLLADSALNAIFNQNSALLTADQRPALQRMAVNGASMVASELSGELTGLTVSADASAIEFELRETAMHPEAVSLQLTTAVSFAALHLVAVSIGDSRRAASYRECMKATAAMLAEAFNAPPRGLRLRPCYY